MKKFYIIIFLLAGFTFATNAEAYNSILEAEYTETSLEATAENVEQVKEDVIGITAAWKSYINSYDGISLDFIYIGIILILASLVLAGIIIVILVNLIQSVTPKNIDDKLQPIAEWAIKYLIKSPTNITKSVRDFKRRLF